MKKLIYLMIIIGIPMFIPQILAQGANSDNITLLCKTDLDRYYGAGDVWGLKIAGTHYALLAIDGGLSVINTNNTSIPVEIAHINKFDYSSTDPNPAIRLSVSDVETFTKNGITYAYLATDYVEDDEELPYPLVMIININEAISDSGDILIDPRNPAGDVYVGKIDDSGEINQSHSLTIAGNYLYVSTLNDSLPVWDLGVSPTSPQYKGFITVNPSDSELHEMYVKSTGSTSSKVYASALRGGLHVIDFSDLQNLSFTVTTQSYHSDKKYADQIISDDPLFDFSFTHSAWPNADGSYIFTTDELKLFPADSCIVNIPGGDANLYTPGEEISLYDAHRQGAFMRTWKTSQLGTSSALKGGFYVPEGQEQGITDLSQINNSMIPSSIHAVFGKDNCLYVTHYTQGLRVLDISDPENLVEVGYYDDYVNALNVDCNDPYFFRSSINNDGNQSNWFQGIFGVFPDPNRPGVVYAGSLDEGFYIFDVLPDIAAPTGFTISGSVGENPTLSWNASSAVGLDGYKLYQKFSGSYSLRVTLDRNTTSFTDNGVIIGGGRFDPRTCYILTAFNITGRESVPSFPRCTGYSGVSEAFVSNDIPLDDEEVVSYQFNLLPAYPNPFNPSTQISYSLAEDAYVTVKVYDMLGTEVANLINETQTAGIYERNFNAENLASGVYIYRVVAVKNGRVLFTDSKQMILLR